MSSRAKHMQRSHKTYSKNTGAFIGFQRNAMTKKQRMEANDNKATIFEKIAAAFNRFKYHRTGSK
jgi:hypothetical protein